MLAIGVDASAVVGLTDAITRGRAAAMRLQGEWIKAAVVACIVEKRDPWGRGWRPKSPRSDGGSGPALQGYESRVRVEYSDTSWNVFIDGDHASTHQFGRARKGDRRTRPRRGASRTRADGTAWQASQARSGSPARPALPLRVRNSGRQEPLVDMPEAWTQALDAIMAREIQREIDALRPTGNAATAA